MIAQRRKLELYAGLLVNQAEKNIEKWGLQNMETLGLASAEEMGELAQSILQHRDEGGEHGSIRDEAIDLGALTLQVILLYAHKHGAENVMKALGIVEKADG